MLRKRNRSTKRKEKISKLDLTDGCKLIQDRIKGGKPLSSKVFALTPSAPKDGR